MGKTIIITEKPSVAGEYAKVLGIKDGAKAKGYLEGHSPVLNKDIQITWAVGHLIELGSVAEQKEGKKLPKTQQKVPWKKENLPIFPEDWLYKVSDDTRKQYDVVKSLYTQKDIDCILYAGDSGREGIYIQALIRNQIFKKAPKFEEKVVWIDSYTDESIKNGIRDAKPYTAYQNMIDSGYERAKTDWLIGMNFSQCYSLANNYRNGVKVIATGRVMSPVLDLVVKKQEEIDNFKPTDFFTVKADCPFNPQWKAIKGSKYFESDLLYNETGFKKKEDCENFIKELNKDMHLSVKDIKTEKKTEYAPLLFNLAELQNHCSKTYHISPDATLKIAQSLYEKKVTTYPRTDARVLSSAVAKDIEAKTGKKVPSKYVDDSKITDHYAIIPTGIKPSGLNDLEQKVYDDINKRYEAIFMPPYVYNAISITYEHQNKECFFASGRQDLDLGYKKLYDEKAQTFDVKLSKGDKVDVKTYDLGASQTKPPTPYTTGTLILTMEKAGKFIEDEELRNQITCGIGTSATRAGIIEKLAKNGYITIDKKQKVAPTNIGKQIDKIIEQYDAKLLSPEKTADMEQRLNDIAEGKVKTEDYEKYVKTYITDTINTVFEDVKKNPIQASTDTGTTGTMTNTSVNQPTETYECPKCKGNNKKSMLKFGRFGFYCENKCGFSFNTVEKKNGVLLTEKDLQDLIKDGKTKVFTFHFEKSGKTCKASIKSDPSNQYGTSYEWVN